MLIENIVGFPAKTLPVNELVIGEAEHVFSVVVVEVIKQLQCILECLGSRNGGGVGRHGQHQTKKNKDQNGRNAIFAGCHLVTKKHIIISFVREKLTVAGERGVA